MTDLVYVSIPVVFFALCVLYAYGCERLRK
jgi:hypothetical protein